MEKGKHIVGEFQNVLSKSGLEGVQIKTLDLIPKRLAFARSGGAPGMSSLGLDERIVRQLEQVLEESGLGHLRIGTLDLSTTVCPPGEVPTHVCEPTPDGGIRCYIKCVKE